jgi:3-methyladenine DNA glycosylase AlkD
MNSPQLISHIRDYCKENTNAANVIKYSRYFKEGCYDAYGLSTSQMDSKTKELLKMPELSIQLVLDAAPGLFKSGKYEEIAFVLLLIRGLHKHYTRETFDRIETWYAIGINNWAHADTLGMQILPVFVNKNIIEIADFKSWLTADNKFQRRSVPVTFIKSLKTHNHFPGLFSFIECLMTDPEREVHQGTGWFLREAWKRKPEETEAFLFKWKDVSPRLIFQYATEKMSAEQKMRFRKRP